MACIKGLVLDGVSSQKRQCKRLSDGQLFSAQNAAPCTNTGLYPRPGLTIRSDLKLTGGRETRARPSFYGVDPSSPC
jgi:hypothetical protein